MKPVSNLFNEKKQTPSMESSSVEHQEIRLDPALTRSLDIYFKNFEKINDLIEVKGRLIEYIRKSGQ